MLFIGSILESSTTAHTTATHTRTAETWSTEASTLHLITCFLASENVQTIDNTYHTIAVDTVVCIYRTTGRRQGTCNVALFSQDIVPFQAQGQRTLQETLSYLCIPNQFVLVHVRIRITATGLIGDVCRNGCSPRCVNLYITTIRESIRFLIVDWVQFIFFKILELGGTSFQPHHIF